MLLPTNLIPLVACAAANMGIGFLWYSPVLFGKPWMKLMGYSEKTLKAAQKSMGPQYALSAVAAFVTAVVLSLVQRMTGISSLGASVQLAVVVWFGFIAPVQLTSWIFSSKKKELLFIDTGYQLASMLAMGVILGL